jgi:hypothetical protein
LIAWQPVFSRLCEPSQYGNFSDQPHWQYDFRPGVSSTQIGSVPCLGSAIEFPSFQRGVAPRAASAASRIIARIAERGGRSRPERPFLRDGHVMTLFDNMLRRRRASADLFEQAVGSINEKLAG